MRQKYEVFVIFDKFKDCNEKQSGVSINFLGSDRGKEYISNEFDKFCKEEGVKGQLIVAYTPQQISVSKRKNRKVWRRPSPCYLRKGCLKDFGL